MEMVPVPPAAIGSQFDNVKVFEAATGWKGRTSKHARDAAKIVFKSLVLNSSICLINSNLIFHSFIAIPLGFLPVKYFYTWV
jgi:hypothetical protein